MTKFCSYECREVGSVCDFCKHYDFNADEEGNYTGDGYCNFHKKSSEPEMGCDEFICNLIYGGGK